MYRCLVQRYLSNVAKQARVGKKYYRKKFDEETKKQCEIKLIQDEERRLIESTQDSNDNEVSICQNIPKFEKIFGWDKNNRHLGMLKKAMNPYSHAKHKENNFVLEGKLLIVDAMENGFYPNTFVFSRLNLLNGIPFDKSRKLAMFHVPYTSISVWSDLSTSPGLLARFDKNFVVEKLKESVVQTLPLTLIIDKVGDPSNMGALLRCAASVGCNFVITTKGCTDPWQPKVLRSGAGAHFRIPIHCGISWEMMDKYVNGESRIILADLENNDTLKDEGLNKVAFSLWRMQRSKAQTCVVVIVGGETKGISEEAVQYVKKSNRGDKLYIPMRNGMHSLNVASAASIILFHVQSQMLSNE